MVEIALRTIVEKVTIMLFNSYEFIIFLPIVFLLYWFVFNRSVRLQNIFVVFVSYIFYGWWDWRFLLLIAFTSTCSFVSGVLIERYEGRANISRGINITNIVINLLILCLFKYYNFFAESFANLFGADSQSILINLILPVGISFYTFQALSYSIDVYRKTIKPTHDIVELFAYVSFFPQLVAGPIERATSLLPQFAKKRSLDYDTAIDGCRQMLWGFFKKIVISDLCAVGVNNIFASYSSVGSGMLLAGAVLFSFQIYGDFSGYSDIAIGCSKLFGIELRRNFNMPYFSRNIIEFWRRWHISLTTWFRDYIYIPLGGSRGSKLTTIRNVIIIFLVSGLWHGANWTYIAWGAYHSLLFIPLLLMGKGREEGGVAQHNTIFSSIKTVLSTLVTFVFVSIGFVIFRAPTIEVAIEYIVRMFTAPWLNGVRFTTYIPLHNLRVLAYAVPILLFVESMSRRRSHAFDLNLAKPIIRHRAVRCVVYYSFILYILYNSGEANTFIYFQF